MRQPEAKSTQRNIAPERRRELEARLAEFGLAGERRPLRLVRKTESGGEADYGRRLSAALSALGPVFAAFGLYLSTRVDLLPAADCLALAEIPDQAPAQQWLQGRQLRAVLEQELRCDVARVFAACEARPHRASLLFQTHHARLLNGAAVEVSLRHDAVEQDFAREVELLPLLQAALDARRAGGFPLAETIADFRRAWQEQCNLARVAEALSEYARETAQSEWVRAPLVQHPLCTPRLLVVEHLPGLTLAQLRAQAADELAAASAATGMDARYLPGRLCQTWLQQALAGRLFPVAPRAAEITLLPNQQFAFTGGLFARLPAEAQANLSEYLIAVSTQDCDRACACLLRETNRAADSADEDALRRRLRQVVPFRDGGWDRRDSKETLAEHVWLHCRLANEHGYRLRPRAQEFFSGLFFIAAAAERLAPAQDPLQEGLEDWRVNAALAQFREMFGLAQVSESADQYAAVLMEMPKRLDQALTLVAEGTGQRNAAAAADTPRRESLSGVVVALMLLLITSAVLSHYLSAASAEGWVDKVGAVVFVAVGVLLLRSVSRRM
jgi:predicted unusual protein kinase regulating ubiquinone biosynthesis (AarF/ABC1/UbiB family)